MINKSTFFIHYSTVHKYSDGWTVILVTAFIGNNQDSKVSPDGYIDTYSSSQSMVDL